jgi:hypothetical protein
MIINIEANCSEETFQHKRQDGLLARDRYCYWRNRKQFTDVADIICPKLSKNYMPDKHREAASSYDILGYPKAWVWMIRQKGDEEYINVDHALEVRLHMTVDGQYRGYFKCFGANLHFTELWFHSEHWMEGEDGSIHT